MVRNKLAVITLLMAFCLGATLVANADPIATLKLTDGVNSVTLTDNGSCTFTGSAVCGIGDLNSDPGVILWSGKIGDWTVNTDTGLTSPGTLAPNVIQDLNFIQAHKDTGSASTLTLQLSVKDYSTPGGVFNLGSAIGGTQSGLTGLSYNVYFDQNNGQFSGGLIAALSGPLSGSPFSATGTAQVNNANGLYSLMQELLFSASGAANVSGDAELQIPEPASMSILGAGLLGLAGFFRRKLVK